MAASRLVVLPVIAAVPLRPALLRRRDHGRWSQGLSVTEPRVATVAGRPILLSSLEDRLAEWRRGPRGRVVAPGDESGSTDLRRWVVQELVAEAVLAHEARAAAPVDRGSPGNRRALARRPRAARGGDDGIGSGRHARSALVLRPQPRPVPPSGVPPRPARPRLGRGVGATRRSAAGWRRRHGVDRRGASRSTRGARREGGLLGDIHRGELSGPLEDALFAAEVGAVVGPIWTEHGLARGPGGTSHAGFMRALRDCPRVDRGRSPRDKTDDGLRDVAGRAAFGPRGHRARVRAPGTARTRVPEPPTLEPPRLRRRR